MLSTLCRTATAFTDTAHKPLSHGSHFSRSLVNRTCSSSSQNLWEGALLCWLSISQVKWVGPSTPHRICPQILRLPQFHTNIVMLVYANRITLPSHTQLGPATNMCAWKMLFVNTWQRRATHLRTIHGLQPPRNLSEA